ncbi:hypothetical protein [Acinetobacter pittii]|uniref:hypothetical protein n=1 Tax=Acinetobacter pittii TaxID=48296 RepID=UPI001F06CB00|nr:hypothetical protein [Acinetobacter pittii]MCH2072203.1 hypothetical protein [Acinetobacter pittii]
MNYNFLTFIITVLIINLSPGPAMIYVMNQSSKYGIKAGLKAAAGVEFGVFFLYLQILTLLGCIFSYMG